MSHESLDSCWQTEYSSEGSEAGYQTPELTDSSEDGESETSSEPPATPPTLLGPDFRSRPEIYTPLAFRERPKDRILASKISFRPINNSYVASATHQSPSTAYTSSQDANDQDRRRTFKRRGGHMISDRFISVRGLIDSLPTQFQVGRNPLELSSEEKVLRHRPLRDDPFMPTRPRRPSASPRVPSVRPHYGPHFVNDFALIGDCGPDGLRRQISAGAVWNVGGSSAARAQQPAAVFGGVNLHASGTTAPMHAARFLSPAASIERMQKYQSRVALALDLDPAARVLTSSGIWPLLEITPNPSSPNYERLSPLVWKENAWKRAERSQWTMNGLKSDDDRTVPTRPFRILDAPRLRDDFYSSTLAYSATSGVLAVGLGTHVYLWSEAFGVQRPPLKDQHTSNYVTSLSFSSENGSKSILAIGKRSGMLCLWSVFEPSVRFRIDHPDTITCVAFKQTKSRRPSERFPQVEVDTEDLAVGDDNGYVWYYSVEWSDDDVRAQYNWHGAMTLLAKISAHSQQICGIAWSPDGTYLATGGNDNSCLLFELEKIIPQRTLLGHTNDQGAFTEAPGLDNSRVHSRRDHTYSLRPLTRTNSAPLATALLNFTGTLIAGEGRTVYIPMNCQKHRLTHSAAVKAIAFAPWRPSLLATGGGSNDRAIHFYHTPSGTCLATINVYAQVTSLIWSKTRRQIVATFGFAQPEHPFRIAVFAWPSCEQIAAIPWGPHGSAWDGFMNNEYGDCGRALSAVSYPGRPPAYMLRRLRSQDSSSSPESSTILERLAGREQSDPGGHAPIRAAIRPRAKEGGLWCSRTTEEGCIIVASSDQTLKFHEVWTGSRTTIEGSGPYGGSEILEALEGFEKPGREIIR